MDEIIIGPEPDGRCEEQWPSDLDDIESPFIRCPRQATDSYALPRFGRSGYRPRPRYLCKRHRMALQSAVLAGETKEALLAGARAWYRGTTTAAELRALAADDRQAQSLFQRLNPKLLG